METPIDRAIAIVAVGSILPDAPNAKAFWDNVTSGRYSISDVDDERWKVSDYWDPDPHAQDKTYSKIGGWVRDYEWDPFRWRLPIPPKVGDAMDIGQKWAVACTRQALLDFGYPERPLDLERTAVILGNAMAGEKHYRTTLRITFPEIASALESSPGFGALDPELRRKIAGEMHGVFDESLPEITEDTMPGELSNCIAGRIANLFNFRGPNYVVDAACASAMAALSAAVEGLTEHDFDAVITGGIDRNMGASSFVKFCKIGALSATGTRPYADGADGFVMGEGAVVFLLKRLADAEKAGDRIYAVLRGVGGSSDGKGRGITAPNPVGQKLSIERAWKSAGLDPASVSLIEGHGTSTRVGDVVEVQSLAEVFGRTGLKPGSVPLGSVKSNIGHLKAAAGAAGLLKATLCLHEKKLVPSLGFKAANPNIPFGQIPFAVNTEYRDWPKPNGGGDGVRRAGVSAFGFGGTNFHCVLEEHVPGMLTDRRGRSQVAVPAPGAASGSALRPHKISPGKTPVGGALLLGATAADGLKDQLARLNAQATSGHAPLPAPASADALAAPERIAIQYADATDLADKTARALKALSADDPKGWQLLRGRGVFRGRGQPGKVAFLYTGQGSQYANMLHHLAQVEPVVRETFAEADRVMLPLLGKPLTDYIFLPDDASDAQKAAADAALRRTEITQPAVLATDIALTRLLAEHGLRPDLVMGHSLGEYGALVAAGCLTFQSALEVVSARGREMAELQVGDNGILAAVAAPTEEVQRILDTIDGYVVIANINSHHQSVIGGATPAVERAIAAVAAAGHNVLQLNVSHAFHTEIVAPASRPLRDVLLRMQPAPPEIPVVSNVTGEFHQGGPGAQEQMIDLLARQVASPVQFVKGLETLYAAGARVFVEVGPKRALQGMVDDVLGDRDVDSLFTNHPKFSDDEAFTRGLCGLWAAGVQPRPAAGQSAHVPTVGATAVPDARAVPATHAPHAAPAPLAPAMGATTTPGGRYAELGQLFADVVQRGAAILGIGAGSTEPVVVSGAALGLPGTPKVFDDGNVSRILHGEQFIDVVPSRFRRAMLDKHITRLVKSEERGASFEKIDDQDDVIRLAARAQEFDFEREFGISADRIPALDRTTQLAMAAGIDALRDAGIPLAMHYKKTSKGTFLPERWILPESLRDQTGVIFASAFPGLDAFAGDMTRYHRDRAMHEQLELIASLRSKLSADSEPALVEELERRTQELERDLEQNGYAFDRRYLFRILAMGHSQFAEFIGARGPNTQVNSACASTTQAMAIAQDWIQLGRCQRVVIVAADDVTSDNLLEWIGAGFLITGAAATDDVVEKAALPFDRRRHGMLLGMGAAAIVVESQAEVARRGLTPLCEVLATITANSAFHGTRLDVNHICGVMEQLVSQAEQTGGVSRAEMAKELLFVSHETYTPARGGSASAEIHALRTVFGAHAEDLVIANTKGFTGHPMGVGIEDVVAVKALETAVVPPVANYEQVDPELGRLNLSKGGNYPVRYALRLGAGFGSQISMTLIRQVPAPSGKHPAPDALGYRYRIHDANTWRGWLAQVSGHPEADVIEEKRTLKIEDRGPALATAGSVITSPVGSRATAPAAMPAPVAAAAGPRPVAMPAAPPATSPTAAAAAPAAEVNPVQARVLEIVAQQTGYPPDMLDIELDLEADLGIDTVKQAETFAAVREAYGIPREENLKLRDFPTLGHVVQFVFDRKPELKTAAAPAAAAPAAAAKAPVAAAAPAENPVQARVLEIVAAQTGYPPDMLDIELDLEADLGIDTVKQAETFAAVREAYGIPREENLKLRDFPTLGHVVQFVFDRKPELKTAAAAPAAAATAPVAAAAAPAENPVQARVLEIVAAQTGYPPDMLDMELDLEADLGIDTVKQAETFAAVREAYDIPREENLKLRDFPTLGHVVQFVFDRKPELKTAAAAPAAAATAPVAAAAAPAENPVQARVLEIVAAQTGYPPDMLDMELDLEADLGIDTVKQAETFAAVREAYDIPREENLKLRDFPTLGHVVQFVFDRKPELKTASSPATATAPAGASPLTTTGAEPDKLPRREAVATLRPMIDACKPTGVTLDARSRVVVMLDRGGVGTALVERLRSRNVDTLLIEGAPAATELEQRLDEYRAAGPITGVFWLAAADTEPAFAELDLARWREQLRLRVKLLATVARNSFADLDSPSSFFVAATRMGGRHGYDSQGAFAPMGGAVSGFIKALGREREQALVKVVDFEADADREAAADALLEETLVDRGAMEIGRHGGLRYSVTLVERDAAAANGGLELDKNSVFVITGAAGSIVSAITQDLAAASGGTFHLLDLATEPARDDADLAQFVTDRDGLKRDLFERLKASGQRATPAAVEKQLAGIERSRAALDAMLAVERAGGRAVYHQVDLRDSAAVSGAIQSVRDEAGRVDVLLHAAGLEISRILPDKTDDQFDLIFDVKADGWFNLMHAIGDMPLRAAVVFSSIAGRFGNGGQTDYSAANDLLCKMVSNFRHTRPDTLGIALDWTAWSGIGMAARGSIPKMMELAGIGMLPPALGVPVIRNELRGGSRGEFVVALGLGALLAERDETGGVEPRELDALRLGPMLGRLVSMGPYSGVAVETSLDAAQPFLNDHRIDETPVLPGVMGLEAFAELGKFLAPGLQVRSIENVQFLAPFKLYRSQPRTLTLFGLPYVDGDELVVRCRLVGSRKLPKLDAPQITTHFTGEVRLGLNAVAEDPPEAPPKEPDLDPMERASIYEFYFHGPAYQVLERAWSNAAQALGRFAAELPPNHQPESAPTLVQPRFVELCFQTAGIWEKAHSGRMALPAAIGRVVISDSLHAPENGLYARVTPAGDDTFDARVVDGAGRVRLQLEGYRTIALTDDGEG